MSLSGSIDQTEELTGQLETLDLLQGKVRQLPQLDSTLSKEGHFADAKAVGDALKGVKEAKEALDGVADAVGAVQTVVQNVTQLMGVSNTFQKNEDGTLTTTYDDGRVEVFQKNEDGSLQTTYYLNGEVTRTQKVTINDDGSIRTEITDVTEGGAE